MEGNDATTIRPVLSQGVLGHIQANPKPTHPLPTPSPQGGGGGAGEWAFDGPTGHGSRPGFPPLQLANNFLDRQLRSIVLGGTTRSLKGSPSSP